MSKIHSAELKELVMRPAQEEVDVQLAELRGQLEEAKMTNDALKEALATRAGIGGSITVVAGNAAQSGGSVRISSGASAQSHSGEVVIETAKSDVSGPSGPITLQTGLASGRKFTNSIDSIDRSVVK